MKMSSKDLWSHVLMHPDCALSESCEKAIPIGCLGRILWSRRWDTMRPARQASRWPGPLGRRPGRAHQNSGSWDTGAQCFCFAGTRIPVTWDSRPLNWDAYPSCGTQLGRHLHAHWDHKPINWDATGTQLGRNWDVDVSNDIAANSYSCSI